MFLNRNIYEAQKFKVNYVSSTKIKVKVFLEFLFRLRPHSTCWGLLKEKLRSFSWKRFPSAFDWMVCTEDSTPFQNTRPFGLENTPSHFVSSGTPA